MDENLEHVLRERHARYVVDTQGQPVAVLLTIGEYEHYLDLLNDETDSQDPVLAARLAKAASQSTGDERQSFRDYLRRRGDANASPLSS